MIQLDLSVLYLKSTISQFKLVSLIFTNLITYFVTLSSLDSIDMIPFIACN